MSAYPFISHRLFVAAVGNRRPASGGHVRPEPQTEIETGKAESVPAWHLKPAFEPRPGMAASELMASGFTVGC